MAQIKKLKLNGKTIYPVTHPKAVIDPSSGRSIAAAATQSANGLMSAADKKKLDSFADVSKFLVADGVTRNNMKISDTYIYFDEKNSSSYNEHWGIKVDGTDLSILSEDIIWLIASEVSGNVFSGYKFNTTSDIKLKDNIRIISLSELSNIEKIRAKSYTLKGEKNNIIHYGFIAQDVEKYFPELVSVVRNYNNIEESVKSLDYTELLVLKVTYLENENSEIKEKLQSFEDRVKKLESLVAKLSQSETEV